MASIDSFSLIDVQTRQPIAGYDPLLDGAVINVDELPSPQFTIRANPAENVASMGFTIDGQATALRTIAPFALAGHQQGNYLPLEIALGDHVVVATPINAQQQAGTAVELRFSLVAKMLRVNRERLTFDGTVNQPIPASTVTVFNEGQIDATVSVDTLPSWITAQASSIAIQAGESRGFEFTAAPCTQVLEREAAIKLIEDGKTLATILASQTCQAGNTSQIDVKIARAYFMQSTTQQDSQKNPENRVPLVAGRDALFRAFVTSNTDTPLPELKGTLHYRLSNGDKGTLELTPAGTITREYDEGKLDSSYNVTVPKEFIASGTEVYITIDEENTLLESNKGNNRFPREGYWELNIRRVDPIPITFVPIIFDGTETSLDESTVSRLLALAKALHPVVRYDIEIREPYSFSGEKWGELNREIESLRASDNSERYYYALSEKDIDPDGPSGVAKRNGKAASSIMAPKVIAHELGHNFGRPHAPCGGAARPDPNYPYNNGVVGVYGYDFRSKKLQSPDLSDIMTYCRSKWISDYNYNLILQQVAKGRRPVAKQVLTPIYSEQLWHIEGSLIDDKLSIDLAWQESDAPIPNNFNQANVHSIIQPNHPYWVELHDATGNVLGRTTFTIGTIEHVTEQYFKIAVSNDIPNALVQSIVIGGVSDTGNDKPLANMQVNKPLPLATLQKAQPIAKAVRTNGQHIQVEWPIAQGTVKIYSDKGLLIAQDSTGTVDLFSNSQSLTLKYFKDGQITEQLLTVTDAND